MEARRKKLLRVCPCFWLPWAVGLQKAEITIYANKDIRESFYFLTLLYATVPARSTVHLEDERSLLISHAS